MTLNLFKNLYLGVKLNDDQMADIPKPRFELHYHVMFKTVEMGSILGMCVIGPVVGLLRGRSIASVTSAALAGGRIGAGIGVVAGPVMTEAMLKSSNATQDSVYDRSYRIRYNTGQMRTDRFATYGAIVGVGAAQFMGAAFLNGGIIGLTAGTLFAGFYNSTIGNDSKKETSEKVAEKQPEPEGKADKGA